MRAVAMGGQKSQSVAMDTDELCVTVSDDLPARRTVPDISLGA